MSLSHSPKIITDGLAFAYDIANTQKSWKGKPTTNLQLSNMLAWSNSAGVILLSELSPISTPCYSITDDSTSSYLGSVRNIVVPNDSNTYTISIYIKKTTGATSARLGFNTGFTGGTSVFYNQRFNSDTGSGNTGTVSDLGYWWRWQFQITNNNTGNTTLSCAFYPATGLYNSGDNAVATGTAIVSAIQVEQSDFATPFVVDARSNTQAILDLTNQSTVTASSLTYASDNTFSFNGTNNYITIPMSCDKTYYSINWWMYPVTRTSFNQWLSFNDAWNNWSFHTTINGEVYTGTDVATRMSPTNLPANTVVTNVWQNFTYTFNNGIGKFYKNGALLATKSGMTVSPNTFTNFYVGSPSQGVNTVNGKVSTVGIYSSKVLSDEEILQNFNALRGRYGL